eukprot:CAMPEP_0180265062 /NCGR_PEP_ID=MMETSP0988-20121125/215_1 /TAXON_ID=697907 /ORGANISM="non described non described, Strain CCMP2293" /LENGTH=58 /DNA_ID=CAMNT_0022235449 /DNA_START=311 /DNA_END=487 /DNA_ORIENTATION=-
MSEEWCGVSGDHAEECRQSTDWCEERDDVVKSGVMLKSGVVFQVTIQRRRAFDDDDDW